MDAFVYSLSDVMLLSMVIFRSILVVIGSKFLLLAAVASILLLSTVRATLSVTTPHQNALKFPYCVMLSILEVLFLRQHFIFFDLLRGVLESWNFILFI